MVPDLENDFYPTLSIVLADFLIRSASLSKFFSVLI